MKLGLFITGHFRNSPQIPENYLQFTQAHDTKVYVSTWKNYDVVRHTHAIDNSNGMTAEKLYDIFGESLARYNIRDPYEFEDATKNQWTDAAGPNDRLAPWHPWTQRILNQWHTVYDAYCLATPEEYNSFDVVLRIRGDMSFIGHPPIPLDNYQHGLHVNGFWWTNTERLDYTWPWMRPFRCSDQMGWGTPFFMRKYFEYSLHYIDLFVPLFRDTNFHYGSEHMFAYYILKHPYFKPPFDPKVENDMAIYPHGHRESKYGNKGVINDYYLLCSEFNK